MGGEPKLGSVADHVAKVLVGIAAMVMGKYSCDHLVAKQQRQKSPRIMNSPEED